MSNKPQPPQEPWENDAVWNLLDASPMRKAGPRFSDDVVRLARLDEAPQPWWHRIFTPIPMAGLAGAAAALVFGVFVFNAESPASGGDSLIADHSADFDRIQEVVETETLLVAMDHLDDFSDEELVSLIGF